MIDLVAGRPLRAVPAGADRYERILAECFLPDGRSINLAAIRAGTGFLHTGAPASREARAAAAAAAGVGVSVWSFQDVQDSAEYSRSRKQQQKLHHLCYLASMDDKEDRLMNVSIGQRWEAFVESIVKDGRYSSASEVVREGLRLVEEREAKLSALRQTLDASIAEGGERNQDDVGVALTAKAKALEDEGY